MRRQKSSGLTLGYAGKSGKKLTQLQLSILFNAYFNFSGGIPGVAMNTWKANIVSADSESITIKKPTQPNVDILRNLDPDWLVIIALFIQHKNMDINKLTRITGYDQFVVERWINNLFNAGIIVKKGVNTYRLGRNIEPFLVNVCVEKGII
jgi:hypothetical protein